MIDFEAKFAEYLHEYQSTHTLEDDKLEEIAPELYLEWLKTPKTWLEDKSPIEHFKSFIASELIEQLGGYILSGTTLPGVLLNQIADTKSDTYPYLISLLKNYEGEKSVEIKNAIVRLIEEMDMPRPFEYYIEVVSEAESKNDFIESAAEELKTAGEAYVEDLISAFEHAKNRYVSDCFLDILCDISFDKRIYQFALDKFMYNDSGRAFYASCLGKLGYAEAMPYLEESLREDDITFYDYIVIKNAIEELGGEVTIDRDFSGDKDYESLKNWRDNAAD